MDKKADWKESLKQALKDKRLLGAGLAGLAGAAVGGGVLPGLIYKKPTWGSRFWMGGASGISTFLIALAAMQAAGNKNQDKSLAGKGKGALATGKALLQSTFGADKSKAQLREMGEGQKAAWGLPGTGTPGWFARRWHESKPKGFLSAALGLGVGGYTGSKLQRMAQNWNRASSFRNIINNMTTTQRDQLIKQFPDIAKVLDHPTGTLATGWDAIKALGARASTTKPLSWLLRNQKIKDFALNQRMTNPFLFTAGKNSAGQIANNVLGNIAKDNVIHEKGMQALRGLATLPKNRYQLPAAKGFGKLLRVGRRSIPILLALAASYGVNRLTGDNKSYNDMISQDLYSDLNK